MEKPIFSIEIYYYFSIMKFFAIVSLIACYSFVSFSQQYPFKEGFQGILNGQIPPGWSGDIPVLGYHGVNDEKGLASLLSSGNRIDSIVSPLIGTINSASVLVFYYRWVMDFIYPSDPRYPNGNDKLEVFASADSVNFTLVQLIDSFNHKPSLNFKRIEVPLGNFAGENIQLKFKCSWGGGKYFQDIDSVVVQDGLTAIGFNTERQSCQIFPNPASGSLNVFLSDCLPKQFSIFDAQGKCWVADEIACSRAIDVSNLPNGFYFFQVNSNTQKFVVLHN
jgi:hypothetical protein